jgi:colanic acid biosynthesis glycosyl transferase WcaI
VIGVCTSHTFVNAVLDKKIVFVNRFFYPDHSATSQFLTDLAVDLARDGMNVHVVTSRLRYDDPGASLPAFEAVSGVKVHRVWTSRFGRGHLGARALDYLTFYVGAARVLWRLVDRDTVLVAKTDPPLISVLSAPIAVLRRAALVNWLQDLFPEVAGKVGMRAVQGPVLRLLRMARNLTLRVARTNVVLGNRMESLVRRQGIPASRVRVIHNWADGEHIRPVATDANPLRTEWGVQGRFVVGYSGNLGRAHEFSTILDAAKQLSPRQEVVFLFIGGGAQRAAVEHDARERRLPNVLFHPYQPRERLHESLSVPDVHLVSLNPALEGLIVPSKFYGIAAAARPTLFVGDVDGEIASIIRDARCGYAVQAGDAAALARRITQLADDAALTKAMGERARELFDQQFDRRLAVRAWREVLEGVPGTEATRASELQRAVPPRN